jgi:hypothetical protein
MERPILFSGPMVRAILDGRKTQTRRVVKFPNGHQPPKFGDNAATIMGALRWYAQPGDRLWVRETLKANDKGEWYYAADNAPIAFHRDDPRFWQAIMWVWAHHKDEADTCVSIHMPRFLSRLTLEIVNVRVERLQEISAENCMAEGIDATKLENTVTAPRLRFYNLWESINAKRAPWASNPWVWVVEFRVAP